MIDAVVHICCLEWLRIITDVCQSAEMFLCRKQVQHCSRTIVRWEFNILDNNPGFELEGIYDCHMYNSTLCTLHNTVFVLSQAILYICIWFRVCCVQ